VNRGLVLGLLLLFAVGPVRAEEHPGPVLDCPRAPSAPVVDGKLDDAAWEDARAGVLTRREQLDPNYREAWTGPADLSARVRALRRGGHLYLGFEVRDDHLMHEPGRSWWTGDSIEVFFDTDLRQPAPDGSGYQKDNLQLFLMPFHESLSWGVMESAPERPFPDGGLGGIKLAWQRTEDGYTLEVRIPLDSLAPLRPDAGGRIGFDLALNDVDEPGADKPESYMTLSGRFKLSNRPDRFGKLAIGTIQPVSASTPSSPFDSAAPLDPIRLFAGLAGVAAIWFLLRRFLRAGPAPSRVQPLVLGGAFLLGAVLLLLAPGTLALLADRQARSTHTGEMERLESAARGFLDLERREGDPAERAERLFALLREGRARHHPPFRYFCVPTATEPAPPTGSSQKSADHGIALAPGESKRFPLPPVPAGEALLLFTSASGSPERDSGGPGLFLRFDHADGTSVRASFDAPTDREIPVRFELPSAKQKTLGALTVQNRLSSRTLVVSRLVMESGTTTRILPLATRSAEGIPFDIWKRAPASSIRRILPGEAWVLPLQDGLPDGVFPNRLWLAMSATHAYPRAPFGADAAEVHVLYENRTGERHTLRSGPDLRDPVMGADTSGETRASLRWETPNVPIHYDICSVPVSGERIRAVRIRNLGAAGTLQIAAATLGERVDHAPDPKSGLVLRGRRLELRAGGTGLGLRLRAPGRLVREAGSRTGLVVTLALPSSGSGVYEVFLPRPGWHAAAAGFKPFLLGAAYFLLAFGLAIAAAPHLQRARRLRVKMLLTLGTASAVPLLFLFFTLHSVLTDRAENSLERVTRTELTAARQRLFTVRDRAHALAVRARDTLEIAARDPRAQLASLLTAVRQDLAAGGAFLRVPELDPRESPLRNLAALEAIPASGLYYSPWDGLLAVGVAHGRGARRYIVAIQSEGLLDGATDPLVLLGPGGTPIAATREAEALLDSRAGYADLKRIAGHLAESEGTFYAPVQDVKRRRYTAAFSNLRDGGRFVGSLGLYRSRADTEASLAATRDTLSLVGLGVLLLVVLAGGALIDRVTARLQRLTGAAHSLAEGDLSQRVPVEADDEVARLALSFNTMADALDRRVRQLTDLQTGLRSLTAVLDLSDVVATAAEILSRQTGATRVAVYLFDTHTNRLDALHGSEEGVPARVPDSGAIHDAITEGSPHGHEQTLYVPLAAAGRVVGLAVCVECSKALGTRETEASDLAVLDATGRQIGIAMENARLYRAAVTDAETGLYTASFLSRRLKEETDRASAGHRPLALIGLHMAGVDELEPATAAALAAEAGARMRTALPGRTLVALFAPGHLVALLVETSGADAKRFLDQFATQLADEPLHAERGTARPELSLQQLSLQHLVYPDDGESAEILLDRLARLEGETSPARGALPPGLRLPPHLGALVRAGPAMRETLEVAARVAPTNATVLLRGESGAGKKALADLIQANSGRRDRPYRRLACTNAVDAQVETALFGTSRESGRRAQPGILEAAHTGTILLDEIGALPLSIQDGLLGLLRDRKFVRVGGTRVIEVDVRVLATTTRDLEESVRQGLFRQELLHRLHVVQIRVPPLRERREEIPPLIERFRLDVNVKHRIRVDRFSPDALDLLYAHPWPGNVSELQRTVERSMLLSDGPTVESAHLDLDPRTAPSLDLHRRSPELSPRQERILTRAITAGGITNRDIVDLEEISPRTALRELQTLVDKGVLSRIGHRRGAVYRPAP